MKNFKRVILFVLIASIIGVCGISLAACGDNDDATPGQIAFVTDKGSIKDGAFNQDAYTGIKTYADKKSIPLKYYQPTGVSEKNLESSIELAIRQGSKVVVTAGFYFEPVIYKMQTLYPDIKFILLDGSPRANDGTVMITENTAAITFAEEQAGYLAGYAAGYNEFTRLAFFGGEAIPSVQAFGYGFLQGVERAVLERTSENPDYTEKVDVQFLYANNFEDNDANVQSAKSLYESNTDVIFACGGSLGKSVIKAAEAVNAAEGSDRCKVIGVDSDQRAQSYTVITSALKELGNAVTYVLKSIYEQNSFAMYGGKTTTFNVDKSSVGLPTTVANDPTTDAFDRMTSFGKSQYNEILAKLQTNKLTGTAAIHVHNVLPNGDYIATPDNPTVNDIATGLGLTKIHLVLRQIRYGIMK